MLAVCYCGRVGEITERQLGVGEDGKRALRCPNEACGHLDHLRWLPEDARMLLFEEAGRKRHEQSAA